MSILFSEIYTKAIALFDDPKITKAYNTNEVQFYKLMYTYLQNAIALFINPVVIGAKLSMYEPPQGLMDIYEADGVHNTFMVDESINLYDPTKQENIGRYIHVFIEDGKYVEAEIDYETRQITFPDILPKGKEYAFEQYYIGEFTENFNGLSMSPSADNLIIGQIKDVLARLLVKAWAEEERNLLLDIRNLMQDSDFKIMGNDRILRSKNAWVDQLDSEILQIQNKLAWGIRFMKGSQKLGRG